MIPNVRVVPVLWGPNLPSQVATGIGTFYTAIVDSGAGSSAANGDNYFAIHGTAGSTRRTAKAEANVSGGQSGGGGGRCPPGTIDLGGLCPGPPGASFLVFAVA